MSRPVLQLKWVTQPDKRDKPGKESHVMEMMGTTQHASAYALTAPEAEETDPVMDCEFLGSAAKFAPGVS